MSGLYIHIPFCKQACSYCDFYFVTRASEREHFVARLIEEIRDYAKTEYARETVETIYFGGGTPSLLNSGQVRRILFAIGDVFAVDTKEVTIEMNPDDVSADFLLSLKDIGISRASMGVQTFQPDLLKFMNRAHSREEALRCIEVLGKTGFESYTVDLIYGNPGQSLDQLDDDLQMLLQFEPPHVSAYSLTIEPRTRLGKQVELGRIAPPKDDNVAEHFNLINKRFHKRGIHRYEVSNYSRPGREAIHNSNYWEHKNYLGFGPGAHSFWWDAEATRWENEPDLKNYLQAESNPKEKEILTNLQLAEERLMMGLRTRKGVGFTELENRYGYVLNERQIAYLDERQDEGKLELTDYIVLTDVGIKIADAIILDLVTLH
ncbi:MAG: radical SAM family heme chaperone HemW [Balneolaceae bacterium]